VSSWQGKNPRYDDQPGFADLPSQHGTHLLPVAGTSVSPSTPPPLPTYRPVPVGVSLHKHHRFGSALHITSHLQQNARLSEPSRRSAAGRTPGVLVPPISPFSLGSAACSWAWPNFYGPGWRMFHAATARALGTPYGFKASKAVRIAFVSSVCVLACTSNCSRIRNIRSARAGDPAISEWAVSNCCTSLVIDAELTA